MSAFASMLLALLALPQGQGQGRLRVVGPQPAVVVFPQSSQIALQIQVANEAEMRRVAAPRLPTVDGLRFDLGQPHTSSQTMFDGRTMTQSFTVTWVMEVVPARVGDFKIPTFDVPVGNGNERTPELTLRVVKDMEGDRFGYLQMHVQPQRVYVHEPFRVRFDLGIDESVEVAENQDPQSGVRYYGIEVAAPWLDQLEGTVTTRAPEPDTQRRMNLVHSDGQTKRLLPTEFGDRATRDGHPFQTFSFTRAYLPSRPGTLHVPATAMGFDAYTGETRVVRDLFGSRRERVLKTFYVYAPAVDVEVLPLPENGKPSPFYGAVGRFAIDARIDKNRVKVGNSVKLIVSIRGSGNTEFLQVPDLGSDIPGFHLLGSKERREAELVEVTYDLTPLRPDVTRTPVVSWNFFDTTPGVERYVEVGTPALPLQVEALPESETLRALPGENTKVVVPGVDDIFDIVPLTGEAPVVLRPAPGRGVLAALLVLPWLLAGAGLLLWRARVRARADVARQRDRGARKTYQRVLTDGKAPFEALVGYLADRLAVADAAIIGPDLEARLRQRGVDPDLATAVARAVEAGVAARYGGGGGLERQVADALVDRLERVRLRAAGNLASGLPVGLLLALLTGALGAQDARELAARGEAAYRAGDYAAAATAFAAAGEASGADRRVLYDLGNALYRQGQYARALVAYERARLGMPRDRRLAANIALTRSKLDLGSGEGEPFAAALAALRDLMTPRERVLVCLALHVLAAACLVLGWRRLRVRLVGFVVLLPAVLLAFELLVLAPARPAQAIVVADRGAVTAEPRADLAPVVKLRRGASVAVVAEGPKWMKVQVGEREGYLPSDAVQVVR